MTASPDWASASDSALLRACKRRPPDRAAWDECWRRFFPKILLESYRQGRAHFSWLDRDDLDDVAQEAFLRLIDALPRLKKPGSFPAFLQGIVHNLVLDAQRRKAKQRHRSVAIDALSAEILEKLRKAPAPAGRTEPEYDLRRIESMLADLSPKGRLVIMLILSGKKRSEIARELGIKPASVTVLRHRAIQDLRQHLHIERSRL